MKVNFITPPTNIKNKKKLKEYILKIIIIENRQANEINFIFCNDDFLLKINQLYLKHNYYTDIITFDLSQNKNEPILSDIYISKDRVTENAKKYRTTFVKEIHRVIFHGILHLCGYKDKTKRDQKKMREMENFYLDQYGI